MSTIVVIIIAAVVILAILAFVLPRMRARAQERQLNRARGEAADSHREVAEQRMSRARLAEKEAQRERAEAELHQTRAQLHEDGLADDQLDEAPQGLGRFEREDTRSEERTSR